MIWPSVNLTELNNEVNQWTASLGIQNSSGPDGRDQNKNAFAHAYVSAHIAYDYGHIISNLAGDYREDKGLASGFFYALMGKENYTFDTVTLDASRDRYNNRVGNEIADYANSHGLPKEALGYLVADAIKQGQLITNEFDDPRNSRWGYSDPVYTGPSSEVKLRIRQEFGVDLGPQCFPAHTPVAVSPTQTRPICDLRVGDTVLAFDPAVEAGKAMVVLAKGEMTERSCKGRERRMGSVSPCRGRRRRSPRPCLRRSPRRP